VRTPSENWTSNSAARDRQQLAGNGEIDVVVLIVAYPWFTLHEGNALLHERPALGRVESWDVGVVDNHSGDADTLALRAFMKCIEMVGDRLEVDGQLLVPTFRVELDAIAKLVEYPGWKRD
jgi:hypothetical protein